MPINFYPMRPINGGRPQAARVQPGVYALEPKYNGWRCMVNTKDGSMFTRHRQSLTIARDFRAARDEVVAAFKDTCEWVDCEGLERRHGIGKGSLIVLDIVTIGAYASRGEVVSSKLQAIGRESIGENKAYSRPSYSNFESVAKACEALKEANSLLKADFYEGVVAKRVDSMYKVEHSQKENPSWIKYRFL